jgi:DNA-binding NarL/FixJ family response regulator
VKRILIVDDSPLIRRTVRQFLEKQPDWEVCGEAVDGVEGIQKTEQLIPDLIVLDMSMPVMNGLDAAREIRRRMPRLPILMFTSHVSSQTNREAFCAGVTLTRSKSEGLELLRKDICELLEVRNGAHPATSAEVLELKPNPAKGAA